MQPFLTTHVLSNDASAFNHVYTKPGGRHKIVSK